MLRLVLGSVDGVPLGCTSVGAVRGTSRRLPSLQPGGEWAIGRWEGNLVEVGTSAGTAGLNQVGRVFIVERSPDGGSLLLVHSRDSEVADEAVH